MAVVGGGKGPDITRPPFISIRLRLSLRFFLSKQGPIEACPAEMPPTSYSPTLAIPVALIREATLGNLFNLEINAGGNASGVSSHRLAQ
jgi:hypothetical protein